jgi:hypothetical protein
MGRRSFLLLSTADRRPLFDAVLEGIPVRSVATVLEAVRQCVSDPPLAVLMDLSSTLHSGVAETAPLYDLGIDLPILRCTGGGEAPWIAMCQAPFRRLPLAQAVQEIAAGDLSWKHPVHLRRFVRVSRNARILFAAHGTEEWKRGNTQSMSVSGLFLMTQDAPPVGTDVDVRLLDCAEDEIRCTGTVVWVHRWEEGTHIPGCGLNFDQSTVPEELGNFLADSFFKRG